MQQVMGIPYVVAYDLAEELLKMPYRTLLALRGPMGLLLGIPVASIRAHAGYGRYVCRVRVDI